MLGISWGDIFHVVFYSIPLSNCQTLSSDHLCTIKHTVSYNFTTMNAIDGTSRQLKDTEDQTLDDTPSLLSIIIDAHVPSWEEIKSQISISEAVASILVFINAHLALHNSNCVNVIGYNACGARILYPPKNGVESTRSNDREERSESVSDGEQQTTKKDHSMYRQFKTVDEIVQSELWHMLNHTNYVEEEKQHNSAISGALSLALGFINKHVFVDESRMRARILLLTVGHKHETIQYIPTMNCIFAAQKLKIPVDVCKLGPGSDQVFLQQACDSTNGIYMDISERNAKTPKGLVQYLLSGFISDPSLRPHVVLPTQSNVDFRAACFLTKQVVDIGYVCSVCLCIMSQIPSNKRCPTCDTAYSEKTLAGLGRKPLKKKKKKVVKP